MELDNLKSAWNTKLDEQASTVVAQEVQALLRLRTGSVVARIKKSIWFELAACFAVLATCIWAWIRYPLQSVHFLCGAAMLVALTFCGYLYSLYRKMSFYEQQTVNIREQLRRIITILELFIRLYYRISLGLLPVIFLTGLVVGYVDLQKRGLVQGFRWSAGITYYTIAFGIWSLAMLYFTRWYINQLYGNYLRTLKQQLEEIENG